MSKTFTYADAVRLLGGDDVTGVEWMDRIARGTLRGISMGMSDVLSCFGVRTELVRIGRDLVRNFTDRRQGLGRFDRTRRIQAAHSIIVITAYFEALHDAELPFDLDQLELTKAEQVTLVVDHSTQGGAGALIGELLDTAIPLPTPQRPREDTVRALRALYESLSARLIQFATGLAAWERQVGTDRRRFVQAVRAVPATACERYELLLRDLAVAFPEVANWANLQDHQATRHQIRELRTALAGLERLLGDISGGAIPNARLVALTRAYRADLDRPIVESGDVPEGLQIPMLGEAYVDPRFRVADVPTGSTPSEESWWRDVQVREDMNGFLAGYLTSPQATQAPLLVLGQPGSGKSVLTRVLAARLPPSDFLVVRVVLREIPADMDLQDQIEQSIRHTTGERIEWPALVRSAGKALPVVLLDGFDEMLQATGVSQTDYLVKVRAFQQREFDQERPVAAVVTSRITVANRARIPDDTVAVRLESFDRTQVVEWLDMWRDANERYFSERGMTALPVETALVYQDLAEQPLLLLMLALYDADNNLLQGSTVEFSRADLYERLLARFARREVSKSDRYSGAGLDEAVKEEFYRLSIVAFAMFNRASQFVTEADLDRDLTALLGASWRSDEALDFRAPLGAAELVLGQFFFIQESQAFRGDRRLHTYEFLHATFGEFLVARLIWQVLDDILDASSRSRFGANRQDDGMLFALLSFSALSSSPSVIGFLTEFAAQAGESFRLSLTELLRKLCTLAQVGRTDRSHVDYEPRVLPAPTRHSIYTANLVILVVIVKGEAWVTELFDVDDPVTAWYQHALLWRSQMSNSEYVNLVDSLAVSSEIRDDDTLDVRLHLDDGTYVPPDVDLYETYFERVATPPDAPAIFVAADQHPDLLRRRALFALAKSDAVFQHVLEPLVAVLKDTMNSFVRWPNKQMQSAAYLLMQSVLLPLGSVRDNDDETMATVYRRCAQVAMLDRLPWSAVVRDRYCALLLDRLRADGLVAVTVVDEVLSLLLPRRGVRTQLVSCVIAVLGRDSGCDRALLAKLHALVDAEWAAEEPALALEAWLRVVEVGLLDGVEGFLATAPSMFEVLDPLMVRLARPELMTRVRWAVADRGYELPSPWVSALRNPG